MGASSWGDYGQWPTDLGGQRAVPLPRGGKKLCDTLHAPLSPRRLGGNQSTAKITSSLFNPDPDLMLSCFPHSHSLVNSHQ